MHKNTKLLPYMRRAIYEAWINHQEVASLAREYKVTRKIIYEVLRRARMKDFENHKSTNHRWRTIEYGLKKLSATEKKLQKKIDRLNIKRYEKSNPGEMVHFDTKKLPLIRGEAKIAKREHLHVAIDDYSRYLVADILPDKGQYSSAIHLDEVIETAPFITELAYSDNGSAYRGRNSHAFVAKCKENNIDQAFTRVKHPQTNGKAERVIQTVMREWCRVNEFKNHEDRRRSLQKYVARYNYERAHSALNGLTPIQRITNYFATQSVYNA